MPGPLTHIAITDKVFDLLFAGMDRPAFYTGTLFPDIRYLGVIDRSKTHFDNVSLSDIRRNEPFRAGIMFHSLVDKARQKFITDNKPYEDHDHDMKPGWITKIAEDNFFYSYAKNLPAVKKYLDTITPREKEFGITQPTLKTWHNILQTYISRKPSAATLKTLSAFMGIPGEKIPTITQTLDKIIADENIRKKLDEFYGDFEQIAQLIT